MKDEIVLKLNKFLKVHMPPTEECHVVYLLVEIRKILDYADERFESSYPILRFYCDWALHIRKEYYNGTTKDIMQRIDSSIKNAAIFPGTKQFIPSDSSAFNFMGMEELRRDMVSFFEALDLPKDIFNSINWQCFRDLLINILVEQPLMFTKIPGAILESICYKPSRAGAGIWYIKLKDGKEYKIAGIF